MSKKIWKSICFIQMVNCLLLLTTTHHVYSGSVSGSGRYHDGVFDLTITIAWNATACEIDTIKARLDSVSKVLYDATDGAARLGRIWIFNNHVGFEYADIVIIKATGDAIAAARIGFFGESILIYTDDDIYSRVGDPKDWTWRTIAHELAHYVFDLADEYRSRSNNIYFDPCSNLNEWFCVFAPPLNDNTACLMDNFKCPQWNGASEFCWSGNHTYNNLQDARHDGQSCWETIASDYPTFSVAAAGGTAPTGSPPAGYISPVFESLVNPIVRVVLVLDNSGSMDGPGSGTNTKLEDLKEFANQYIDLLCTVEVKLGIVTYNSSAYPEFPLQLLDDAVSDAAKDAVDDIVAGGQTNIGAGMIMGRDILTSGSREGPRIMILLTDGFHNYPFLNPSFEPLSVLESVIDSDIFVHTVALGNSADEVLFQEIAIQSGATYWKVGQSLELTTILAPLASQICGGTRLDSHLISATSDGEPAAPINPKEDINKLKGQEQSVFLEKGAEQIAFNLGWSSKKAKLNLVLTQPNGKLIHSDSSRNNNNETIRLVKGNRYISIIISKPLSGKWKFKVLKDPENVQTIYTLQPTVINKQVRMYASASKNLERDEYSPVINLRANARDILPVIDIDMTALMITPTGQTSFLRLYDDGDPKHGDATAKDGIYSAKIQNLARFGNGTYRFEIKASADTLAKVVKGDEPPPNLDNQKLFSVRRFTRSFPVDVVISEFPEYKPDDNDNDGIPNQIDRCDEDTDKDGIPNCLDKDSDGDDRSDSDEGTVDSDKDGIPDFLDPDFNKSPKKRIIKSVKRVKNKSNL